MHGGVSLRVSGLAPDLKRRLGTRQTLVDLFRNRHLLCGRLFRNRRSTRIATEPGRIEPRYAFEVSHMVARFTLPVAVLLFQKRSPPAPPPPSRIVRWSPLISLCPVAPFPYFPAGGSVWLFLDPGTDRLCKSRRVSSPLNSLSSPALGGECSTSTFRSVGPQISRTRRDPPQWSSQRLRASMAGISGGWRAVGVERCIVRVRRLTPIYPPFHDRPRTYLNAAPSIEWPVQTERSDGRATTMRKSSHSMTDQRLDAHPVASDPAHVALLS